MALLLIFQTFSWEGFVFWNYPYCRHVNFTCQHKPDEWRIIPDEDIPCLAYPLKAVELFDFSGNENDFDTVRFLLKNGHALQRMSINWWRGDTICRNFMLRVRKLPRSSSNVALTFEKSRLDVSFYEL